MATRFFRRGLRATPCASQVLIAWGSLGVAVIILVPVGLTLAQLTSATSRFAWPLSLFHTLEYTFLPASWAAVRLTGLTVGLGVLVHAISRLMMGRPWNVLPPACVIAGIVYLSLVHIATNPDLNEFFYRPLKADWTPAQPWLVPMLLAVSLAMGLLAFLYFDRGLWASLLGPGRGRRLAACAFAAQGVAVALGVLAPFGCSLSGAVDSPRRNVILISMDTLRRDHLGLYGYPKDTSPHLDALSQRGAVFQQAVTQAPWTLPAHMTLFTGLYPSEHGLTRYQTRRMRWQGLSPGIPVLAEVLQEHGYITAAFTGGGFMRPAFGFSRGFDMYRSDARRLEDFHPKVLRWLRRHRRQKFFLFLQFYNTHRPYEPPAPYDTMFLPAGGEELLGRVKTFCWGRRKADKPPRKLFLETVISQYDGEIRFADELLGKLFDVMDELGLTDDTLIVFLSDHGEAFFEHGNCDHIKSLYDPLVRIPLILAGPGISSRVRVEQVVELRDVSQWILDYAGISVQLAGPRVPLEHRIRGNLAERAVLAYAETCCKGYEIQEGRWKAVPPGRTQIRSIQTRGFKLITDDEGTPTEFYDLREDPGEKENLLDSRDGLGEERLKAYEALGKAMAARMSRVTALGHGAGGGVTEDRDVDEETLEQLRALGYM